MANVLDQELSSYIMQLNEAEKKSVLLMLKTFLTGRDTGMQNISIEQYNKEIDEALQDAEAGLYITQEEMGKNNLQMVEQVIWPLRTQHQLAKAYEYILKRSYLNAEKVKSEILASTRKLLSNPEMYPTDKYRQNNDGSFRAYELHHFRISYQVKDTSLLLSVSGIQV